MMKLICKWCNREVPENSKFCVACGRELNDTNNIEQNNFNSNINLNNSIEKKEEKANIGFAILSWFIPVAGLIIFLVKKDKEPKTAKVSGICALISFILSLIIVVVTFLFMFFVTDEIIDNIPELGNQQIVDENNDNVDSDNEGNNGNEVISGNVANDWKEYEVLVNNKSIVLPATYEELSGATGFTLKSSDLSSYVQGGYYVLLNMYKNDKLALHVEVLNDTDGDLLYTDCKVTRVSQTKYQVSQGADVVVFPGGLKVGDSITEAKIIELFGTPNDIDEYSSDGYESRTYKYVENSNFTTTNNYVIKVFNGEINELQLDNRN